MQNFKNNFYNQRSTTSSETTILCEAKHLLEIKLISNNIYIFFLYISQNIAMMMKFDPPIKLLAY